MRCCTSDFLLLSTILQLHHISFRITSSSLRRNTSDQFDYHSPSQLQKMDVLLELPFELSRVIAVDWCTVRDLLALDTAYCNKSKREPWERVLRSADHHSSQEAMSAACKRWIYIRRIPTTKLVWKTNTDFALCSGYLKDLGDCIQEVTINGNREEEELQSMVPQLEMHCNHIVSLALSSCVLDPVVINLLHKATLTHLKIQDCLDLETEITDDASCGGSHHLQLRSVELNCRKSKWFVPLLLKLLDPFALLQFRIGIDYGLPQEQLVEFFKLCCNLRTLSFNGSPYCGVEEFTSIVPLCRSLLHLDISNCRVLSDEIANAFIESGSRLSTLNINGTKLTDVFLEALAIHCSDSLQALYASECTRIEGEGIDAVLTGCTQLRILECMNECIVNHESLSSLTTLILWDVETNIPVWEDGHCAKLKRLRLVFDGMDVPDFDFTQITVQVLPRLQTLAVSCEDGEEEPNKLLELREARPSLRVHYNTDVLTYDLMKLPL